MICYRFRPPDHKTLCTFFLVLLLGVRATKLEKACAYECMRVFNGKVALSPFICQGFG
jgi:hypothetical protein